MGELESFTEVIQGFKDMLPDSAFESWISYRLLYFTHEPWLTFMMFKPLPTPGIIYIIYKRETISEHPIEYATGSVPFDEALEVLKEELRKLSS